jgi:hypothetical protein
LGDYKAARAKAGFSNDIGGCLPSWHRKGIITII